MEMSDRKVKSVVIELDDGTVINSKGKDCIVFIQDDPTDIHSQLHPDDKVMYGLMHCTPIALASALEKIIEVLESTNRGMGLFTILNYLESHE